MTTLIAALIAIASSLAAALFAAADGALLALEPGDPSLSPTLRSLAERRERPHRALAFARILAHLVAGCATASALRFSDRSLTASLLIAVGACLGLAAGLGVYTFGYARGSAYLTNDPAACANCHVMRPQFEAWMKGSHHAVAGCNDCHAPASFAGKYYTKATNGFWHSFYFTTGGFPDPIRMRARNRAVTEGACRRCHADVVEAMSAGDTSCIRCHSQVGHDD